MEEGDYLMPYLSNNMVWAIKEPLGWLTCMSAERDTAIRRVLDAWYPEEDLRTQHDRSVRWKRLWRKGFRIVKIRITEVT